MSDKDYNQWWIDYPEWMARHLYNTRWNSARDTIEIHMEFCAFYDWNNLWSGNSMDNYPSFTARKIALKNTKGNPAQDFVGPIAAVQGRMKSKGADIYTHDEAQYRYGEDPKTEGIWWDDGVI